MAHCRHPTVRMVPWVLVTLAACGGHPGPPPSPEPSSTLVRRDYDQVCRIDPRKKPVLRVSEIFDTIGLGPQLARIAVRPLPADSQSRSEHWRTLDFITRYGRGGNPGPMGVWQTDLDSSAARRVEVILDKRVRRLPRLLEPAGFRTVVIFSPHPTAATAPAVVCLPHMRHGRYQRPPGLPTDVSTWLESDNFRPRWSPYGRDPTATVRIHLDRRGRVTEVDSLAGDSTSVEKTRVIIAALHFYPALRNGEGVPTEFVQSFAFLRGRAPKYSRRSAALSARRPPLPQAHARSRGAGCTSRCARSGRPSRS